MGLAGLGRLWRRECLAGAVFGHPGGINAQQLPVICFRLWGIAWRWVAQKALLKGRLPHFYAWGGALCEGDTQICHSGGVSSFLPAVALHGERKKVNIG